ncbi:MAG: MAPEG family protein [Shimia sp.]
MPPELLWLTLTMLLAASLWIPFIVHVDATPSGDMVDNGLSNVPGMARWGRMAHRGHLNLLEQAMPFAVPAVLAHVLGVSATVTAWAAAAFFWLRVAHAVWMMAPVTQIPVRPTIFTAAWLCCIAIGVEVLRLG